MIRAGFQGNLIMADLGNYKGHALIHLNVLLNDGQQSSIKTTSGNPLFGSVADETQWELSAGDSITFFYYERSANGNPPDNVIIRAYYETGTGTLIREIANSNVSSGSTFTFWATDDGTETGAPRAGTLRMYMRISGGSGAVGTNYDVDSDGNQFSLGGAYTAFDFARGVLRANSKVSDLDVSAYPAGNAFAYGAASDEAITLTATHTQPYEVRGHEHVRIDALDGMDQQIEGDEKDIGSATSTTQQFAVNNPNFDDSAKSYGAELIPVGVAQLLPDSDPAMLWTTFVADGVDVQQNGTGVRRQSFYDVDPRITLQNGVVGESVYNRGETAEHQFELVNARGESLTRSVGWDILDGADTTVASVSDTGPTYSNSRVIGDTELALPDDTGDQWSIVTTLADAYNVAANIYGVSRKWIFRADTGEAAGTVFTDKTASPSADGKTLFNRGQDVFFRGLLFNVRGEALGAVAGFFAPRRTDQEAYELPLTAHTLAAGGELTGASATYAVPLTSVTSPAGRALVFSSSNVEQPRSGGDGQGNFAETDIAAPEWTITDQYSVTMRSQKEPVRNTDPVDTVFTIGDDAVYHFVQVLDASGDPVEGATVEREQYDPNGVLSDSGQSVSQADGWTSAAVFQPNTPKGGWTLTGSVDNHDGNTGTDNQLVSHVSAFTANKAIISGFGPAYGVANSVAGREKSAPGDLAKPGDRLLIGMAFLESGARVAVSADPPPSFMLAQFNQADSKVYVLQDDLTWANNDETGFAHYFFDFKQSLEDGLEWVAAFGTAGQGVNASNGYVTDTGSWDPAGIFLVVQATYNGQSFYTGRSHPFAGPSAMHPMSAGDVFDLILDIDQGAT